MSMPEKGMDIQAKSMLLLRPYRPFTFLWMGPTGTT